MTLAFLLNRFLVFIVLIISVVMHELSHGAVADAHGDPTPRMAGRLTWNPLAHLDPVGTIFIILIVFLGVPFIGWAKPVPINPAYFRDYRRGMIAVSLAGPFANFSLLILCMGILYFIYRFGGSAATVFAGMLAIGVLINLILMLFNLLPIPPLDGSKVLSQFLSWKQQIGFLRMEGLGIVILLVLVFTGLLGSILSYTFIGLTWVTQTLFGAEFALFVHQALRYMFPR